MAMRCMSAERVLSGLSEVFDNYEPISEEYGYCGGAALLTDKKGDAGYTLDYKHEADGTIKMVVLRRINFSHPRQVRYFKYKKELEENDV